MASIRPATRYTNSLNSSTKSDPSSSTELPSTRALAKRNDSKQINLGSMVKKLVESKNARNSDRGPKLVIANDLLAEDLKKNAKKSSGLSGLHKKLFKGTSSGAKKGEESSRKALTEAKSNTRTLGMVLKSERELLNLNKQQDEEIADLKALLQEKRKEVEKLKDLCLRQRQEIKSLKSEILFPDVMNSELQGVLDKQNSELKQARQLIPGLHRQVTSLTGQLQCLAQDLAEVKADKYSGRGYYDNCFSPSLIASNDQEEAANSLVKHFESFDQEYSSGDFTITSDSPDHMFLKDLNPCLTPYSKTKSKEFDVYGSPEYTELSALALQSSDEIDYDSCIMKLSKSSELSQSSRGGPSSVRPIRWSDGSKRAKRGIPLLRKLL